MIKYLLCIAALYFADLSAGVMAQVQEPPGKIINVYLDCNRCDKLHIRRNINFVNYVRDPQDADVHVLVTDQHTGSGGRKYEFHFIGLKEDIDFRMDFNSTQNETYSEVRDDYVRVLKAGLLPFVTENNKFVKLEVTAPEINVNEEKEKKQEKDPWHYWVFEVNSRVSYEKEELKDELALSGGFDADKITPEWRIRLNLDGDYEESSYKDNETYITTFLKRYRFWGSDVKSINDHWSAGLFGSFRSDTYRNIRAGGGIRGAVEYNIYPYDISNRKELTFAYYIGPFMYNYFQETIYNKKSETLWGHTLRLMYRDRQPWGNIDIHLEGFNYFHDFKRNHLQLDSWLSIRLVKGLFFRFGGEAELIRDQLYLAKEDISLEEVLLERKALQTDFSFDFRIGLSYTFGSIYNNFVNTRL